MKNLKTILKTTEAGKWNQTDARKMKAEIEGLLRDYFANQDIEIYETEKGFNVELFDANGQAFALNINPVVKAYDFDIVDDHELTLADRQEKLENAKAKKEASEKKKALDKAKREAKKVKKGE